MNPAPRIVLASASPRRSALLAQLGVPHLVRPAGIDETTLAGESIEQCVRRLARDKAQGVWDALNRDAGAGGLPAGLPAALPVLGADTVVVADGQLLGKPRDRADALRMLGLLSGREHEVLTAVALRTASGLQARWCSSTVRFRTLERAECELYWATGEPVDKAGAYAIQGLGAIFIESLRGSYSGVMGLPLFETSALLAGAGLAVLAGFRQSEQGEGEG